MVNGFEVDGDAGLVQLLDLAQREVIRSFPDAVDAPTIPLRGSQFRVLSMVPPEGGRRLTDLSSVAAMTKQAMGEFVADLAERGFVVVEPDPADRRARLVSLTPEGREAAAWARQTLQSVEDLWARRLSARDVAALKRILARVAGIG
ncbi:MAG: MarR family winged helix-turn-helix transcriptional regulator [Nocardioidaceae bacterium]